MKTTAQYLDLLRAKLGADSDGQLIKFTGWRRNVISRYRCGRSTFDDETAIKAAALLGIEPHQIIADMDALRAANTSAATVRAQIANRIAQTVAAAALVYFLVPVMDFTSGSSAVAAGGHCILCQIRY